MRGSYRARREDAESMSETKTGWWLPKDPTLMPGTLEQHLLARIAKLEARWSELKLGIAEQGHGLMSQGSGDLAEALRYAYDRMTALEKEDAEDR